MGARMEEKVYHNPRHLEELYFKNTGRMYPGDLKKDGQMGAVYRQTKGAYQGGELPWHGQKSDFGDKYIKSYIVGVPLAFGAMVALTLPDPYNYVSFLGGVGASVVMSRVVKKM